MNDSVQMCPVCRTKSAPSHQVARYHDTAEYYCDVCGRFQLTDNAKNLLRPDRERPINQLTRAALSHRLQSAAALSDQIPTVDTKWLNAFLKGPRLPTPSQQATNAIRLIGDFVLDRGEALAELPDAFHSIIGAPNRQLAVDLATELMDHGLIRGHKSIALNRLPTFGNVNLTLAGWERYEAEKHGRTSGSYGFIALSFGHLDLNLFVAEVVKPCVQKEIGYDLIDMRDVSEAGIIDNIMRVKIRDAAFVLADMSNDNAGAYWEAGYAEGLGKPVIYICHRDKFQKEKSHFDTNHCTTVLWSREDETNFKDELVATLRRSLNLFPARSEAN